MSTHLISVAFVSILFLQYYCIVEKNTLIFDGMKRSVHMGAIFVAGYILALPILFTFHAVSHTTACEHHTHTLFQTQLEQAEFDTMCEVCKLYFEYHPTIDTYHLLFVLSSSVKDLEWVPKIFQAIEISHYNLRGPPVTYI